MVADGRGEVVRNDGTRLVVMTKFCGPEFPTVLVAVTAMVLAPVSAGPGVPVRTPVVGFRVPHGNDPVALQVGTGVPVAVKVKL